MRASLRGWVSVSAVAQRPEDGPNAWMPVVIVFMRGFLTAPGRTPEPEAVRGGIPNPRTKTALRFK